VPAAGSQEEEEAAVIMETMVPAALEEEVRAETLMAGVAVRMAALVHPILEEEAEAALVVGLILPPRAQRVVQVLS